MLKPNRKIPLHWQMFLLSFTALFLELMVIRWVPSVVRLVAYYANLMLLSSFLGLGVGAMASARKWRIFGWFPVLLAVYIGALLLSRELILGSGSTEVRFGANPLQWSNYLVLGGLFAANALVFVPIGEQMGQLFASLPRLKAYAWDLGGSIAGTLAFGLFSLLYFSPLLGIAVVMLLYLALVPARRWWWTVPVFLLVLAGMKATDEPGTLWSPYYRIIMHDRETLLPVIDPPPNLRRMHDPPIYAVGINRSYYHFDASQDRARYSPGSPGEEFAVAQQNQYSVPYALGAAHDRVLVVGAGGGADVQTALREGAKHVDAVEIDPVLVAVSRRFNADAPYDDPRVQVHVDDARSFFSKSAGGYDLVTFGYLDSQALFSYMSSVRLDGFVYTVESIRSAYGLLNEHGMLVLSFGVPRQWLRLKLYSMVAEATGRTPLLYLREGQVIICVSRKDIAAPPRFVNGNERYVVPDDPAIPVPTDDWPFLYLSAKGVPTDYAIVIGSLLVLSVLAVYGLRGRTFGRNDAHFALLGMGFLLLETKSISDSSLYFGTTWLVTLIVITGVLLMVLAANFVAQRLSRFSLTLYLPLFLALALLCFMPRDLILALSFPGRLAWTLLAVPLPVFFAGLIFSKGFEGTSDPSGLFGANLIGAMIGGFAEYLGMAVGSQHLFYLVIAAYAGSLLCLVAGRRAASGATA